MSGVTGIVSATPGFVPGTFDAQDVRLATLGNLRPGLFASGDFAVSERAAGANMSVDIGAGRCFIDPADASQQGLYLARLAAANAPYNTLANGGYTWTAADATNPRIDLVCIEVEDQDFAGSYTGYKFRIVDGTPNASATSQNLTAFWPAIPAGCVVLAPVLRPAGSTTILAAHITNLNAVGGHARKAGDQVADGFAELLAGYSTPNGNALSITVAGDGVTPMTIAAEGFQTMNNAIDDGGIHLRDGTTELKRTRGSYYAVGAALPHAVSTTVPAFAGSKTFHVLNWRNASGVPTLAAGASLRATWAPAYETS